MLEKLDPANIPNAALIDETCKNLEYDPTNEYSVPYTWGTVCIVYNTTMVDEGDLSQGWGILWDEKYANNILMFNNSRDAFAIAGKMLGKSLNPQGTADVEEAAQKLKEQKGVVQSYVMDEVFDKMSGGEAALAPYYTGDGMTMMQDNPDLAIFLPAEGTNRFVDGMCIPKGARHKEAAEMFINFMCETQVALANAEYICYSSPQNQTPPPGSGKDPPPFPRPPPPPAGGGVRLQRQRLGVPRDAGRHAGPFGLWLLAQRPPAGAKASIKHLLQGCMPCKKLRPGHAGAELLLRQSQTFQIEGRGIFLPGAAFFPAYSRSSGQGARPRSPRCGIRRWKCGAKAPCAAPRGKTGVYWLMALNRKFCGPSPARKRSTASESRRAPGRARWRTMTPRCKKPVRAEHGRPSLRQHPAQSGRGHGKIIRRGGIFARKRAGNVLHIRQPYIHIRRQGRTVCSVSYPPVLYTTGSRRPCARASSSAAVTHGA